MQTMVQSFCIWVGVLLAGAACQPPTVSPPWDGGKGDLLDADAGNGDLLDADAAEEPLFDALPGDCVPDAKTPTTCEELGYTFGGELLYTRDCRADERRCRRFVHLAAGEYHACAVLVPGELTGYVTIPVENPFVQDAVGVATGWVHACTLQVDGTVSCWGRGSEGQLGEDGLSGSQSPVTVAGISDAGMVASGYSHICALVQQGKKIMCWGLDNYGQLGKNFSGWQHSATPLEIIP